MRFPLFFPPTFVLSIYSCFHNCPNVHSTGHWHYRNNFPLLNLQKRKVSNDYLLHLKISGTPPKQRFCLQTIILGEGRKEGRSLCGDELSAFAGADFPTSLVFIRQPFAAGNHIGLFWTLISCRASLYVCVYVFWRYYIVYKLVGFPPELVYPPSSPLVCNRQCLTQLVTRPCLVLSC